MVRESPSPAPWVVAGAPTIVSLVVWVGSRDPYEAAKLAALCLLAAGWIALWLRDFAATGRGRLAVNPWVGSVLLLLLVAAVASMTAPNPSAAAMGLLGRHSGLVTYIAAGILGIAAAGSAGDQLAERTLNVLVVGLLPLGAYGLLQLAGVEPLGVEASVSGVFVTLGNPNFAGAYAGSLLGVAVWWTTTAASSGLRVLGAAAAVSSLLVVAGAGSVVGMIAATTSVGVVATVWLHDREGAAGRAALPLFGSVSAVGGALVAAGTFEVGPLAGLGRTTGISLRRFYWDAAVDMGVSQPMLGVGFDNFIARYREFRAPDAADRVQLVLETDAAHSVPLQLLSGGGIPLLIAWALLTLTSAWALLRALRNHEGRGRMTVAGLGSVWLALAVQSLASFDISTLLVTSMVTSGLLAGLAWPDGGRVVVLPGVKELTTQGRRTGRRRGASRTVSVSPAWAVPLAGLMGALTLGLALWIGTTPLRAEIPAARGAGLLAVGEGSAAAEEWASAAATAGWEVDYPYRQGLAHLQAGELEEGVAALTEALDRRPGHIGSLVSRARAFEALDQEGAATEDYMQALQVEPHHPDLRIEAARFFIDKDLPLAERLAAEVAQRNADWPGLADLEQQLEEAS